MEELGSFVEDRCRTLEKAAEGKLREKSGYETVVKKTSRLGAGIGGSGGVLVLGGAGTAMLLFGLITGPFGIGMAIFVSLLGLLGGRKKR